MLSQNNALLIPIVLNHFVQVKFLDREQPRIDLNDLSRVTSPLDWHHVGRLVIDPVLVVIILFVFFPVHPKVVPNRGVHSMPLTGKLNFFILFLLTVCFLSAGIGIDHLYFSDASFREIVSK